MSPEKLNCDPTFGKESDMFALGVIWYQLVSDKALPFDPSIGNLADQIKHHDPIRPGNIEDETWKSISNLLDKAPTKRRTATQLKTYLEPHQK